MRARRPEPGIGYRSSRIYRTPAYKSSPASGYCWDVGRSTSPGPRPTLDGTALQQWRAAHRLSQGELAAMLDVPVNTLARWERSEVAIRHPRILELALHAIALSLEVSATRRASRS